MSSRGQRLAIRNGPEIKSMFDRIGFQYSLEAQARDVDSSLINQIVSETRRISVAEVVRLLANVN